MRLDPLEAAPALPGQIQEVVVVDDDEVRGRRLLAVLSNGGVGSTVRADTLDELLAASSVEPRVAVLFCSEVRGDGVPALIRLRDVPALRIVVVAPAATRADVRAAFAAGADGLVIEHTLEEALVPTVSAVASGQLVLPRADRAYVAPPALSTREKQVIGLVVLGFSNPEIAAKLHVAETTVKSHLTASFRKLGVRSRSEASARILDPHDGLGVGILSIADNDLSLDLFGDS